MGADADTAPGVVKSELAQTGVGNAKAVAKLSSATDDVALFGTGQRGMFLPGESLPPVFIPRDCSLSEYGQWVTLTSVRITASWGHVVYYQIPFMIVKQGAALYDNKGGDFPS